MKWRSGAVVALFLAAAAAGAARAQDAATLDFAKAARTNTCAAYSEFMLHHGTSAYATRVRERLNGMNCPTPERTAAEARRRAEQADARNQDLQRQLREATDARLRAEARALEAEKARRDALARPATTATTPTPTTAPVSAGAPASNAAVRDFLAIWTPISGSCEQIRLQVLSGTNIDWDQGPVGALRHKTFFEPSVNAASRRLSAPTGESFTLSGANLVHNGCTFRREATAVVMPALPAATLADFMAIWTPTVGACEQMQLRVSASNSAQIDWDLMTNGVLKAHKEYFDPTLDGANRRLNASTGNVFQLNGADLSWNGCTFRRT